MDSYADGLHSSPASLRVALAEIDAELAALRTRAEELAAARKPIVDALKAIIYPILTLPLEITAEIFLRYADKAEIPDERPCAPPVVLASVCQQWRAVALNLQSIWPHLQISYVPIEKISNLEALLGWWIPRERMTVQNGSAGSANPKLKLRNMPCSHASPRRR
ncbi:hypothetical protein C8R46DRAFT_1074627 [Mycena filopes]|nr:hypothetical protein C8R46DRAFT_1074627 [Mycena filopes]